jgi:DNA repair protein RadA/Sms
MVLAVLQSRMRIEAIGKSEAYVSTVGGMRVTEPAADLAIALALFSALQNKAIPRSTAVIGEVGLAGEVRRVSAVARRVAEAKRLGFGHVLIPSGTDEKLPKGIRVTRVANLAEATGKAFTASTLQVVEAPF